MEALASIVMFVVIVSVCVIFDSLGKYIMTKIRGDKTKKQKKRSKKRKQKKQTPPIFSEEECFLYGIHPNDEMYRKVMELNILTKNYDE